MEKIAPSAELIEQLEYYLGDRNLERDEFFRNKITEGTDGYMSITHFENCNKIKKLGVGRVHIIDAIKASLELELNTEENQVRRKDNKPLPAQATEETLAAPEKKLKTENPELEQKQAEIATIVVEEEVEDPNVFTPLILFVRDTEKLGRKGREIEEAMGKKYLIKIPFVRIGKGDGHLVLDKWATKAEIIKELTDTGFEYEGETITFDVGTDRDRDLFMKDHGRHVGKIVDKKFGKKFGRPKREVNKKWAGPVVFLERKYPNMDALKAIFKGIVMKTRNGVEVDEEQKKKLAGLLAFHSKAEEKLKGMTGFTVGFHPTYNKTRCFFVIKEDGTKDDFSFHKCVHNLVNSLSKKK